jgi:hypothetical protein
VAVPFADEQDVYDHLGRLFEEILQDGVLVERFQRAGIVLQYALTDPDAQITLRLMREEPPQVDLGPTAMTPTVVMRMRAETAHRFFLGRLSASRALATREIVATGPVAKALRLVPLVRSTVVPRYRAQLEASDDGHMLG